MDGQHHGRILVTGATGGIGRQLVGLLGDGGHPVRAMARRPDQVEAFRREGVDAVLGDLGDMGSLAQAMRDCDRLFLLTPGTPAQALSGRHAVEAAARAGVSRVVHLSTADANPASRIPWARAPAHTDALLRESGLMWTLLKPNAFMQNLLGSAAAVRRGFLPQTSGAGAIGWIDSADIARVAARVLVEDGHAGREYVLTGPARLSMRDIAAELSVAAGHRVRYLHLPGPLFYGALRVGGLDPWTARGLVHQFVDVVRHGEDDGWVITDGVRSLTGTDPTPFSVFARRHRDAFATPRSPRVVVTAA